MVMPSLPSHGSRGGTQQAGTAVTEAVDCSNSRPLHAARPVRAGELSGLRSTNPYEDTFWSTQLSGQTEEPELLTVVSTASVTVDGGRSFSHIIPAGYLAVPVASL